MLQARRQGRHGCKDAKSVSVSALSMTTETRRRGGRTNPSVSTTTTDTLTLSSASSTTSSFVWEDVVSEFDQLDQSSSAEQSFSGLLRKLEELEQSRASWGWKSQQREEKLSTQLQDHVKAVVKQSENSLGDFRQSMVQMIVEDGVVAGEELREMLLRFLGLNPPHHHDAILHAFAKVWDVVFFTDDDDPVPATATTLARERQLSPGRL